MHSLGLGKFYLLKNIPEEKFSFRRPASLLWTHTLVGLMVLKERGKDGDSDLKGAKDEASQERERDRESEQADWPKVEH